jgi:hypothetical protein
MSIPANQLRKYIIQPALKHIGLYSKDAEELLLLTAAQESAMGTYIHQLGKGPACGIFQMEPRSHDDVVRWLKQRRPGIWITIKDFRLPGVFDIPAEQMCGNFYYAAAMARGFYLRFPERLPGHKNIEGMAKYYKEHWNTHLGAATVEQALKKYEQYA